MNTSITVENNQSGLLNREQSGAVRYKALNKALSITFLALSVMVYILISLGGLVRNAGAGLSCPDWPLCYGKLIPGEINQIQVFLEWFHRLIAGASGFLLLGASFFIFSNKALRAVVGQKTGLAITLLFLQVLLGGLTVIGLLSPKWVVGHLAVGIAFFLTVLSIGYEVYKANSKKAGTSLPKNSKFQLFAGVLISAFYIQTILGGLVSSHYAGLACQDFPTCNGLWFPDLVDGVKFQFFHRLGALIVFVLSIGFIRRIFQDEVYKDGSKLYRILANLFPALLVAQILLGVGMIFMKIPLLMSVAHLAVAAALMAVLMLVRYEHKYR